MLNFFIGFAFFEAGAFFGFFVAALLNAAHAGQEESHEEIWCGDHGDSSAHRDRRSRFAGRSRAHGCGINTKYATDKNWANAVYNHMKYLYEKL